MSVTHVRTPDHQNRTLCGVTSFAESLSYRHFYIAETVADDPIEAYDSYRVSVPINRAASIRDGVQTLPHPVCQKCRDAFHAAPVLDCQ